MHGFMLSPRPADIDGMAATGTGDTRLVRATATVWAAALGAVGLGSFVVFLFAGVASAWSLLVVNDLVQTGSALGAGLICVWVARSGRPERRLGWSLIAVALVGWGAGQGYWSWSEIVAGREAPFPSPADLGYLTFPVFAVAGAWKLQAGSAAALARGRAIADALTMAAVLFILSWPLLLDPIFDAESERLLALTVALAYPVGDLVVLGLTLLLLSRTRGGGPAMLLLSGGLVAMVAADCGFAYLTTAGTYRTGSVVDVGWVTAFLLCAVAAVADSGADRNDREWTGTSRAAIVLPLVPLAAGVLALGTQAWIGRLERPVVVAAILLFGLIAIRRVVVLTENDRLVEVIRRREEQLRHQAFHDPLTGAANRLLFLDRLEHAATLRRSDGGRLTVLYLDLDDFKTVNDRLGHATGDALLCSVAERLHGCVRSGDTVARLGGDEFAILLEQDPVTHPGGGTAVGEDGTTMAGRIVAALERPFHLGTTTLRASASIGVVTSGLVTTPDSLADQLLASADVAMYAAKHRSKGSFVVWTPRLRHPAPMPEEQDTVERVASS